MDLVDKDDYILDECAGCKLIYQRLVPAGDLMSVIYDEFIRPDAELRFLRERWSVQRCQRYLQQIVDLISMVDRRAQDVRVLDFGMGFGEWAKVALALGCDVYGTEISPAKLAFAQSRGIKTLPEDKLVPQSFDIINAEQVLEHIADPAECMSRLAQALKPGGVIKIGVPVKIGLRHAISQLRVGVASWNERRLNPVAPLEHLNAFGAESMRELGRRNSLTIAKAAPTTCQIPLNLRSLGESMKTMIAPFYRMFSLSGNTIYQRL